MDVRVLGRFEKWNLLLPLFFLALVPIELMFFHLTSVSSLNYAAAFIGDILFLNSIHVILTLAMLIHMPEFRELVSSKTNGSPRRFWYKVVAIFLSLLAFFCCVEKGGLLDIHGFRHNSPWVMIGTLSILAFRFLPAAHHNISQIKGFSLAYNFQLRKERGGGALGEKSERLLFHVFTLSICVVILVVVYRKFYNEDFHIAAPTLYYSAIAMSLLAAAWIMLNSLHVVRHCPNKFLYLARIWLWPMTPFSIAASTGIKAMHGIEYLFLFINFNNTSAMEPGLKGRALMVTVAMFAVTVFVALGSYFFLFPLRSFTNNKAGFFINAFMLALIYTHYYLDRFIFRMSQSENRKTIGPLLYAPAC
jgi:hypothetical protein